MATSWQPPQRDLGTYPQQGFGQSSSAISTDLQPFCNPDDIVDSDVAFGGFNGAQVSAVDAAIISQCFLRQLPRGAQPPHVLGQGVPPRAFVGPFTDAPSVGTPSRQNYARKPPKFRA
jgi:hypothetical protein